MILFVFSGLAIYAEANGQEEIDYLLFLPNSSNQFVNEKQANVQLDNLAKYFRDKNLAPGQIQVYGYAAAAPNDIEETELSRNRAAFVIDGLQKRGVSKDLFSAPVGHGSVDLWGDNANEDHRAPNRRVRILLDGNLLTPAVLKAVEPEPKTETPVIVREETAKQEVAKQETAKQEATAEPKPPFPWKKLLPLLLIPLIAALIFFVSRSKRKPAVSTVQEKPVVSAGLPSAEPASTGAEPVAVSVITSYNIVDLDEMIRFRAYELFLARNCQHGDAERDWFIAVTEICARYEADGYKSELTAGHWRAAKTIVKTIPKAPDPVHTSR